SCSLVAVGSLVSGFNAISTFFFFQAEDGIRDRNVTGVQTCALPICQRVRTFVRDIREAGRNTMDVRLVNLDPGDKLQAIAPVIRSEERRVGKECRSRWVRGQQKKKKEE